MDRYPKHYLVLQKKFPELISAYEKAGMLAKKGPINEKTGQLIQLAACAALRSEGGVHSHTRRALRQGASKDEIYHAVVLLTSTIGFPTTAAAFSWVNNIIGRKK